MDPIAAMEWKQAALRAWVGSVIRDGPGLSQGDVNCVAASSSKSIQWPETYGAQQEQWTDKQVRSQQFEVLVEIPPAAGQEYVTNVVNALRDAASDTTLGERFTEAQLDRNISVERRHGEYGANTWHVKLTVRVIGLVVPWEVSTSTQERISAKQSRILDADDIMLQFQGTQADESGIGGFDVTFFVREETELVAIERVRKALEKGQVRFTELAAHPVPDS